MWIKTQDGKTICDVKFITITGGNNSYFIEGLITYSEKKIILGKFSTEDDCSNKFEILCSRIKSGSTFFDMNS